jgi:hypothetical protein
LVKEGQGIKSLEKLDKRMLMRRIVFGQVVRMMMMTRKRMIQN